MEGVSNLEFCVQSFPIKCEGKAKTFLDRKGHRKVKFLHPPSGTSWRMCIRWVQTGDKDMG